MLQRIQTIYMAIVVVLSGVFPLVFSLYEQNGIVYYAYKNHLLASVLFGLSVVLGIIAIFKFRNRLMQFILNRLNILTNLTLLGIFTYQVLTSSGENAISEKGVGVFLPVVSIVFLFSANKAIKRDENLVKSADRLR